ncbi:hypothetical protein F5Y18DRAFT_202960 [Xylariaceae sp. FL1019]|nr:hypothetical protein F5Y18DRAFT_202960 [Xylariaceae sp. FL1019]
MKFLRSRTRGVRATSSNNDNSMMTAPPSYEESQHVSLREIIDGAMQIAPQLWPSTSSYTPTTSTPAARSSSLLTRLRDAGIGQQDRSEHEESMAQVLEQLATAMCGDRPFLDRVREFSEFYFSPYAESDGLRRAGTKTQNHAQTEGRIEEQTSVHVAIPLQQQQKALVDSLPVPRESVALVLCARVLEEYYAGLQHQDLNLVATKDGGPGPEKGGNDVKSDTNPNTILKTHLRQIAACSVSGCLCMDYDASTVLPAASLMFPPQRLCFCGHSRSLHSLFCPNSTPGIPRLLTHYTNWNQAGYRALSHRGTNGAAKGKYVNIEACTAPGCICPDLDKGRRTGRCARCGHYCEVHCLLTSAQKSGIGGGKGKERKEGEMGKNRGGQRGEGHWELSWILIENGYLLLSP